MSNTVCVIYMVKWLMKNDYPTQLFTVRFWLETLGDEQHEWRGRAQYIESGEVIYFRD